MSFTPEKKIEIARALDRLGVRYIEAGFPVVSDGDFHAVQKIARETNFSETTFVLQDNSTQEGWDVRIFTPNAEVPFAGHPTLGTAYVIRNHLASGSPQQVHLNLKAGRIPVTFEKSNASGTII